MYAQRILCAVDYSEYSGRALRHAAALAASDGAQLHVLHVATVRLAPDVGMPGVFVPIFLGDAESNPEQTLRAFVEAAQLPLVPTRVVLVGTTPYREIAGYAGRIQADLIVLGTHGYSGVDHVLLGSTAERLVNHAPCPVLIVPRDADEPGSQDSVHITNVVCAIDFSPASLAALAHSLAIVREHGAQLTLIHALEVLSDDEARNQAHHRIGEYVAERRREWLQRLDGLVPQPVRASGHVSTVVELGRPATVILHAAEARQADLIVMGAQGHGGLGVMLFGSATHGVLRHATCPVLTARPMAHPRDVVRVPATAQAVV